jgi:hypothetical protein
MLAQQSRKAPADAAAGIAFALPSASTSSALDTNRRGDDTVATVGEATLPFRSPNMPPRFLLLSLVRLPVNWRRSWRVPQDYRPTDCENKAFIEQLIGDSDQLF